MDTATRLELYRRLEAIKQDQLDPRFSRVAYFSSWIVLIALFVVLTFYFDGILSQGRGWTGLLFVFAFQALYTIIRYNVNMQIRPILEALLDSHESAVTEKAQS
jgi:fatty acid desaturase